MPSFYSKLRLILAFLILLSACNNKKSNQFELIQAGKSNVSIFLNQNADQDEERAANLMQKYLELISGCQIPIIYDSPTDSGNGIFIGKSNAILAADGFQIHIDSKHLSVSGGSAKGVVYGVIEILERFLDIRYYSPSFQIIPNTKNISLPILKFSDESPNTYRNINYQFSLDPDYRDFNRLHTRHDMFPDEYFVHTFHRLVPWKEYFETNPDYFAYQHGKRIIDQLCLTNPEVMELVTQKLRIEMESQPEKKVWSVSQDDNFSFCQCEGCSKIIKMEESPAGPIIHFVNEIADVFPDKIISTLAYQYSRKAPRFVKPRSNVQIMLCTIELNRSQPIADDPRSESFLHDLESWGEISEHIFLWDYTVDFAHQVSPFPNLHVLQKNIQLFVENNVKEHFQQTNTGNAHEFSELKAHLIAKLLWNPQADSKAIIHEFTDRYYGNAAPYIRQYLLHLEEEILSTLEWLDIYGPPTNYQETFLSADNISAYKHYFDLAEKAVAHDSVFSLHVRTARMPIQYAEMEIGKNDMFGERGWYAENERTFELRRDMLTTLESFYSTGIECKASTLNEAGLMVEDYYQTTKRFIDIQVDNNKAFRMKIIANPMPSEKYGKGDLGFLTNGVRGANDFKVHWIGWEAKDCDLLLDLEKEQTFDKIEISSLYDPKSWILHPKAITCLVAGEDENFVALATIEVEGNQRNEDVTRVFEFRSEERISAIRWVKFEIIGTQKLFDWHPSAGYDSWFFIDEIVVK